MSYEGYQGESPDSSHSSIYPNLDDEKAVFDNDDSVFDHSPDDGHRYSTRSAEAKRLHENSLNRSAEAKRLHENIYPEVPEASGSPTGPTRRKKYSPPSFPKHDRDYVRPSIHADIHSETAQKSSNSTMVFWIVVAAVVLLVFFIIYCIYYSTYSSTTLSLDVPYRKPADAFTRLKRHLNVQKERFPSQSHTSWTAVRAAVRLMFTTNATREPATILLAGPDDRTLGCLARAIAEASCLAFGMQRDQFGDADAAISNQEIRNQMLHYFDEEKKHVVILRHIDRLLDHAPLILQEFCDGDNAPYKDAVILLTAVLPLRAGECNDATVGDFLREAWTADDPASTTGLSADKVAPILARIANNIVCVVGEPQVAC